MGKKFKEEKSEKKFKDPQPIIEEYKGSPIIRLPLTAEPDPKISWHWLSFGRKKAQIIVFFIDQIREFAKEG